MALLKAPYIINGTQVQDGDYVRLSLPAIRTDTLTLYQDVYGTQSIVAQIYNANDLTLTDNFAAVRPSRSYAWQYRTWGVYESGLSVGDFITEVPLTITNAIPYQSFDAKQNACLGSNHLVQMRRETMFMDGDLRQQQGSAFGNENKVPQLGPVTGQITLSNDTRTEDDRLCLEVHGDFVAFRSLLGNYLHAVENNKFANSVSLSNARDLPDNAVAVWAKDPSWLHTAQWQIYMNDNKKIALKNRATQTFLTVNKAQEKYQRLRCTLQATNTYNYVYKVAATWYNNPRPINLSVIDEYSRFLYPLTCNNQSIDQTTNTFNFTRIDYSTCELANNPMSSACIAQSVVSPTLDTYTAIKNFCGSGDMASTPVCIKLLRTYRNIGDAIMTDYCKKFPFTTKLCGCLVTTKYSAMKEFLASLTPPAALLPECNLATCATEDEAYKTTGMVETVCQGDQICAQIADISGSTGTSVGKIVQTCNFSK